MTDWHVFIDARQATTHGSIAVNAARRLVLEGTGGDVSLDLAIDGSLAWIDDLADRLASEIESGSEDSFPSTAYLAGRSLRYYLVKLLRPVVFFTHVQPLRPGDRVFYYGDKRSTDYSETISAKAHATGVDFYDCSQTSSDRQCVTEIADAPSNPWWRRAAGRMAEMIDWMDNLFQTSRRCSLPLILFHGNPTRLVPIARHLVDTSAARTAWLVDRFAIRHFWRHRSLGRQLVCNSSHGSKNRIPKVDIADLKVDDVDISQQVTRYLAVRRDRYGQRWTRLIEQTESHLRRQRPDVIVLDEDITPNGRVTAEVAQKLGIPTVVLQHGVPCSRFGFLPLTADRFIAQDNASAERMTQWGLDASRIFVAGDPDRQSRAILSLVDDSITFDSTDRLSKKVIPIGNITGGTDTKLGPSVLLLLTRPPSDDRPDAISLHFTGETYRAMLTESLNAARRLRASAVWIRPHPRTDNDPILNELRARFADLPIRMASEGAAQSYFEQVDCAISCGSTTGIEARRAGLPVVQIIPPTSTAFPSAQAYDLLGTAHDADQIVALLTGTKETSVPIQTKPSLIPAK